MSEFSEPGLRFNLQDDVKAERYFLNVFGEQTVDLIVEETNQYDHQSLRNNPAQLATWKNVSKEELKAYFSMRDCGNKSTPQNCRLLEGRPFHWKYGN